MTQTIPGVLTQKGKKHPRRVSLTVFKLKSVLLTGCLKMEGLGLGLTTRPAGFEKDVNQNLKIWFFCVFSTGIKAQLSGKLHPPFIPLSVITDIIVQIYLYTHRYEASIEVCVGVCGCVIAGSTQQISGLSDSLFIGGVKVHRKNTSGVLKRRICVSKGL